MFFFHDIFPIIFVTIFSFIFVTFMTVIIKNIITFVKNNNSPILNINAKVVSKRNQSTTHNHNGHMHHSTTYFVTFETESNDRFELKMKGQQFGLLVEGDIGTLTFQGTRYISFERSIT